MDQKIFENLGFTNAETKVYLLLLELGAIKVGKLIEKSRLQSSTVHNTLHSLIDKGIVNYVLKKKMRIYQATSPKIILKNFQDKEKRFESLIPELETRRLLAEQKSQAEIYEGLQGIMTMLEEMIENTKPKDTFYFFAVDKAGRNEEIQKFFERYDAKRLDKGLIIKGLARKELKSLFNKRRGLNVRYLDHAIPSNTSMCNDKLALITWSERPVGILVKSKQLAQSNVKFFEELWMKATK
jgi:sugar-specific transcriptional regulator TrmB